MQFYNFPEFLRREAKWAVWRYEQQPHKSKPDKPPRHPVSGNLLSVNEPDAWASFDEAVQAYGDGGWWSGIGFLIESRLGVTVVDLDYKDNRPADVEVLHRRIYEKLNSYSEFSPSGQGLHIVCRGVVPAARKHDVEIYSNQRFMSVTGRVLNPVAVEDRQWVLEKLVEEIAGNKPQRRQLDMDAPQKADDDTIIQRAYAAANGDKFAALWEGRWQQLGYPSQSEADFALVNMLVYYTANVAQIRRLFFKSELGQRDKLVERPALLDSMIRAGFDRMLEPVDISAIQEQVKDAIAKQAAASVPVPAEPVKAAAAANPYPDALPPPPGFLGALCHWYLQAAPYPAPEIALAGGLAFMAGLCGAGYSAHGDPLNLFLLLTAPSAVGKAVTGTGAIRLMDAIKQHPAMFTGSKLNGDWISEIIGPSVIASGSALTKHLTRDFMSTISIQEEFGVELEKLNAPFASIGVLQLKQMYLKLGSGGTLGKDIWSDKEKNTDVRTGIAFTLLGESVPDKVYDNLNAEQAADGFIGRLTLIEMPEGLEDFNKFAYLAKPDDRLVEHIIKIGCFACERARMRDPFKVEFNEAADKLLDAHRRAWRKLHIGKHEPKWKAIWGRCANKVARIAALVAIGKNYMNPIVDAECVEWAVQLVERGTNAIAHRFENGEVGTAENEKLALLLKHLRQYVEGKGPKHGKTYFAEFQQQFLINKSLLRQYIGGYSAFRDDKHAFEVTLKAALDDGYLVRLPPNKQPLRSDGKPFNGEVYQITPSSL